jgi:hypothetical protein
LLPVERKSVELMAASDIGLMIVSSNLGHYTKVSGALIAMSIAVKTGGKRKLRFFPLSPFTLFPLR